MLLFYLLRAVIQIFPYLEKEPPMQHFLRNRLKVMPESWGCAPGIFGGFAERKANDRLTKEIVRHEATCRGRFRWQCGLKPLGQGWLREQDLNLWPSGYEPDELPLLYPAISNVRFRHLGPQESNLSVLGLEPVSAPQDTRCLRKRVAVLPLTAMEQ